VIEIRKELATEVMVAVESGHSPASIARRYGCTLDFVADRTEGKEVHLHRSFPTFEEWKSTYVVNNSEFVLNEIESIEEIELNDVRDIMCMNNHSFIANGIVSHNCNYSSKVIEPIQSRCSVFRFRPLSEHDIRHMLSRIAKNEKLELSEDAIKAIIYISEGDMRKAINSLQGAATLSKHISQDTIFKVSSRAKPEEIKKMIELALKGNFLEARGKLDQLMLEYGMSGEDVLLQVYKEITTLDIPDRTKVVLVDRIGEYNFRLVEGANERIQLEALLAQIMLIGEEKEK
jgi:replication factor C small subunit